MSDCSWIEEYCFRGNHSRGMLIAEPMFSTTPIRFLTDCARCQSYRVSPTIQHLAGVGVGAAVLDQWTSAANTTRERETDRGSLKTWKVPTTSRAIALLHFAAVGGYSEAQLALGLR